MNWPRPTDTVLDVKAARNRNGDVVQITAKFRKRSTYRVDGYVKERATRPSIEEKDFIFYLDDTDSLIDSLEDSIFTEYTVEYIYSIFKSGTIQKSTFSPKTFTPSTSMDEPDDIIYDPIRKASFESLQANGPNEPVDTLAKGNSITAIGITGFVF